MNFINYFSTKIYPGGNNEGKEGKEFSNNNNGCNQNQNKNIFKNQDMFEDYYLENQGQKKNLVDLNNEDFIYSDQRKNDGEEGSREPSSNNSRANSNSNNSENSHNETKKDQINLKRMNSNKTNNKQKNLLTEAKVYCIEGDTPIDIEEKVRLIISDEEDSINFQGKLILTNYCLRFIKDIKENSENNIVGEAFFSVPLFAITKTICPEEKFTADTFSYYTIEVNTKDNRYFKYEINSKRLDLFYKLNDLSSPNDYYYFAKQYFRYRNTVINSNNLYSLVGDNNDLDNINSNKNSNTIINKKSKPIYNITAEFERQGYNTNIWTLTDNQKYNICETYPPIIFTPRNFNRDWLKHVCDFRTKKRLPVLCWYSKENKTSMMRSSQTKGGFFSGSEHDQKYLLECREMNEDLDIFDARPYYNALANRLKGAGFENVNNYKNTRITFCEIENIHHVRGCYSNLQSILSGKRVFDQKFLSSLESTGWTQMISLTIKRSIEIAERMKKNSVLIHCSDGWDRTSQLSALTQLLIDPYYRTIYGFCVLIEKEWISFGHQFALRGDLHNENHWENNSSPIFIQWLDCVYQVMNQNPSKFEFDKSLLEYIADHVYSGKFNSFLFNCERERSKVRETTVSIFEEILSFGAKVFLNPHLKLVNLDEMTKGLFSNIKEEKRLESNDKEEEVSYVISNKNINKGMIKEEDDSNYSNSNNIDTSENGKGNSFYNYTIRSGKTTLHVDHDVMLYKLWEEYYLKYNYHWNFSKHFPLVNQQTTFSDEQDQKESNTKIKNKIQIDRGRLVGIKEELEKQLYEEKEKNVIELMRKLEEINKLLHAYSDVENKLKVNSTLEINEGSSFILVDNSSNKT